MILIKEIIIPFLLGFLGFIRLNVVGVLALNEILLLIIAPYYLSRASKVLKLRAFKSMFIIGLAYFFSLIAADLLRKTLAQDYLRGWAKIGITLCSFIILVPILFTHKRALLVFLIGWFLSPIASILAYGAQLELYKFYIGAPISAATFFTIGYAHRYLRKAAHFLPLLASGIAFLQNCRSLAGITLIAQMANFFTIRQKVRRTSGEHYTAPSKFRLIFTFLFFCIAGIGIMRFYNYAAPRGLLGEKPRKIYEIQTALNRSGKFTFLTGRWDQLYTWPKIFESPIIGYGSWPKDFTYVYSRAKELRMNPAMVTFEGEYGLIPAHSHISSGWLEAGIFGGIFWIVAMWRTIKLLVNGSTLLNGRLAPLMTFLLVGFAWDLIFSPYGGERRLWNGFMLAWIVWTDTQSRNARENHATRNESIQSLSPKNERL